MTRTVSRSNDLLTVGQAAELLEISRRAVRYRALTGSLPSIKLPGRTGAYVFHRSDVLAAREASS